MNRVQPFFNLTGVSKSCPLHPWASPVRRECPACTIETEALIRECQMRDAFDGYRSASDSERAWLWQWMVAWAVVAFGVGVFVGHTCL